MLYLSVSSPDAALLPLAREALGLVEALWRPDF
jgi:hypothetical protein